MSKSKKIYLSVTIDTECDKGAKWRVKQPLSFINIYNGVVKNLQPIFEKYNVKATYLLSPEVIQDSKSVEIFKSFGNKVELGTHLHSEFIEPEANFNADNTKHYQSDFKPDIEKEKLKNLTTLFSDTFGYQPLSFRAGRFGISKYSLRFLEDLGYTVDSSVTPDLQWNNKNGNSVNFFGSPYQPYYPSYKDFRKEGDMRILQVPVSLMNRTLSKVPLSIKRKIKLNTSYQHILFNYTTRFSKPKWLRPTYSNVEEMKVLTQDFLKLSNEKNVFLCMMFHSNEFELGMSPYSMTLENMNKIINRLDSYLEWLTKEMDVSLIGMSEINKHYTS
ncbi:polysaccharide deacetylase family protein [Hanstruepera ponticola]|uniref:hypothetical protein n=1 Tax=Hanstruepera ponticola TaxID=2042995 RepID=UPI0013C4F6CF|nr:hypothetical protein [Hanstruepera ponticola]